LNFEILSTGRLQLRKLDPLAMRYLFENYDGAELREKLGAYTDEAWIKEINRNEAGYTSFNRSFVNFQMIHTGTGKIIGSCGFHTWYQDHHRAEIGYAIFLEEFKNLGYMTEAMKAVLQYGFNEMKLNRVEAMAGPGNTASLKLLENFNFTREGLLRSHYLKNGSFENSAVFSLLKNEFNNADETGRRN
jgi:ribosomal-protein-alanine N-acetyltransferase